MVCLLRRTDLLTAGGVWIPNVTCRDSLSVRVLFPRTSFSSFRSLLGPFPLREQKQFKLRLFKKVFVTYAP